MFVNCVRTAKLCALVIVAGVAWIQVAEARSSTATFVIAANEALPSDVRDSFDASELAVPQSTPVAALAANPPEINKVTFVTRADAANEPRVPVSWPVLLLGAGVGFLAWTEKRRRDARINGSRHHPAAKI